MPHHEKCVECVTYDEESDEEREGVRRNLDRYTLVSWDLQRVTLDEVQERRHFWSKRRKIHKLDRSRFALWAKIGRTRHMKESEEHVKERSVMAQLKEEAAEFEKVSGRRERIREKRLTLWETSWRISDGR